MLCFSYTDKVYIEEKLLEENLKVLKTMQTKAIAQKAIGNKDYVNTVSLVNRLNYLTLYLLSYYNEALEKEVDITSIVSIETIECFVYEFMCINVDIHKHLQIVGLRPGYTYTLPEKPLDL
jgi:hypothetical protein